MRDFLVVSNISDASFAIGVAHGLRQEEDISDLISLKEFANKEFCPRFLVENVTPENLGYNLKGKSVYIISTASHFHSRNELAMRNCLIASAAKENGADFVALVEPDLFYSAQDRGPRTESHPQVTDFDSRLKFAGQPWSLQLYATLLKQAGVDVVMTVHNHKPEVTERIYQEVFGGDSPHGLPRFINLDISHIVAHYILDSGLARISNSGEHVCFVAPDSGAVGFASRVKEFSGLKNSVMVNIEKIRKGQREVEMNIDDEDLRLLKGRDVFILDDMVRTGGTISASVKRLMENEDWHPNKIYFYCTHTYISPEGRENLNSSFISQFITTNTIPNILNRDDQGRLRKKTVVLKLERFIANAVLYCLVRKTPPGQIYNADTLPLAHNLYEVDISSKNPIRNNTRFVQYELI